MQHNRTVFFSDMDGTLLNNDKTVSQKNIDAINRFRESGGMFILSTGRLLQATRSYFGITGKDPCILCNGGMIYDCGTRAIKWSDGLERRSAFDMTRRIIERFPDVCAEICLEDKVYDINLNEIEKEHWKKAGFTAEVVDSLDDVPDGVISKILYAMREERINDVAEFCSTLEDHNKVNFVASATVFYEMLPLNASKGAAMKRLIDLYGLEGYRIVAMGDYDNDMEMLRLADVSACPCNAQSCVRDICDIVTESDCEGGSVADVIDMVLQNKITF